MTCRQFFFCHYEFDRVSNNFPFVYKWLCFCHSFISLYVQCTIYNLPSARNASWWEWERLNLQKNKITVNVFTWKKASNEYSALTHTHTHIHTRSPESKTDRQIEREKKNKRELRAIHRENGKKRSESMSRSYIYNL